MEGVAVANNPVQIVLNSQHYVQHIEVNPGGSNTDFYAGQDNAFISHRAELASAVASLKPGHASEETLVYAHVELQENAWAKSHRPNRTLFPLNKIRSLGGSDLGSIVVELKTSDLRKLEEKILSAEDNTNWVFDSDKNKMVAKPSRTRSEVGAIRKLRAYDRADRRKFSVEQATEWLADPRTGRAYYVETFGPGSLKPSPALIRATELATGIVERFEAGLNSLGLSLEVTKVREDWAESALFVVRLTDSSGSTPADHNKLLNYLDSHTAVRAILLPPVLQSAKMVEDEGDQASFPPVSESAEYPVVGIIDTGVSKVRCLETWRAGEVDFIDESVQDYSHGTFIAGLVSGGKHLNSGVPFDEMDCKYYDLGLHPTSNYEFYYPRGFLDFLEQLDSEMPAAIAEGVRIFNMSLSVTLPVEDRRYSVFANILDKMADQHDVIFVLPAGNLDSETVRGAWPVGPDNCLKFLAEYRSQGRDRIFQPADSVRSITVAALDPACPMGELKPSRYSRRGPGPSLGAKPDVAHIGGSYGGGHGLFSLTPNGNIAGNCGTSFSSPLVAKTLAALDHSIEGYTTREALSALLLHNSAVPKWLTHKKLAKLAKDFVGAGLPNSALPSLVVDDSAITLVFNGVLNQRQELTFDFSWPSCLVKNGKCAGKVKITTVYKSPIDRDFGAEFVLVNVDTWLRQETLDKKTGEMIFKNQLKNDADKSIEKERIAQGAKWWPVKRFEQTFTGIGKSSRWRLVLESLCRSGYDFPVEGIPFSTVITISDPGKSGKVFNEMRQQLVADGVEMSDIRTAVTNRLRQ
ncbi:S8 family peptidase [Pseudomonas cichorii]|nr:S8 family peptidase [Pseudomonas cichorii]